MGGGVWVVVCGCWCVGVGVWVLVYGWWCVGGMCGWWCVGVENIWCVRELGGRGMAGKAVIFNAKILIYNIYM